LFIWFLWKLREEKPQKLMLNSASRQPRDLLGAFKQKKKFLGIPVKITKAGDNDLFLHSWGLTL